MMFCEKCGATLNDGVRFCDKCGADVKVASPVQDFVNPAQNYTPSEPQEVITPEIPPAPQGDFIDGITRIIPQSMQEPGDKTVFWIGLGSMAAFALIYIICMFTFMADLCYLIGVGHTHMGQLDFFSTADNTNPLWMFVFIAVNLAPAYMFALTFQKPKYKLWSVFLAAGYLLFTIVSLISWGIMEPSLIGTSWNKAAWFVLMDCLSEMWYFKLLVPGGVIIGYGIDWIVNRKR